MPTASTYRSCSMTGQRRSHASGGGRPSISRGPGRTGSRQSTAGMPRPSRGGRSSRPPLRLAGASPAPSEPAAVRARETRRPATRNSATTLKRAAAIRPRSREAATPETYLAVSRYDLPPTSSPARVTPSRSVSRPRRTLRLVSETGTLGHTDARRSPENSAPGRQQRSAGGLSYGMTTGPMTSARGAVAGAAHEMRQVGALDVDGPGRGTRRRIGYGTPVVPG